MDLPQLARLSFVHQVIRLEFFENRSGSFNFHFNFRNEVQSLIGQVIFIIIQSKIYNARCLSIIKYLFPQSSYFARPSSFLFLQGNSLGWG